MGVPHSLLPADGRDWHSKHCGALDLNNSSILNLSTKLTHKLQLIALCQDVDQGLGEIKVGAKIVVKQRQDKM